MSRITITLTIDVPDGATVAVNKDEQGYATLAPVNGGGTVAATPDAPICGIHHKPMRIGRYGPFCTQQAGPGEAADAKGYCAWKLK